MHGYTSADSIIGLSFEEVKAKKDQNKAKRIVKKLLKGQRVPAEELARVTKNGHIRYSSFSANPIYRKGEIIGAEGFVIDITELKSIERALKIAKSNISQKNRKLKKLSKFKDDFIRIAVHDLRHPLVLVQTAAYVLGKTFKNKNERKYLSMIKRNVNFGLELISDLLDFSKIKSDEMQIRVSKDNYEAFIKDTIKQNRLLAKDKQIRLVTKFTSKIPRFEFDKQIIKQVVDNLISNAIKYSYEEKDVNIIVSKEEDFVLTKIINKGPGILKKNVSKIFKPFKKTSTKPIKSGQATGLGLTIAKKLIEAHGGTIGVESEQDKGTTFYFKIPIR